MSVHRTPTGRGPLCTLVVLSLATTCVLSQACDRVTLSGTRGQMSREGVYAVDVSLTCNGRRVYAQDAGGGYLYYMVTADGWRGWMASVTLCSNSGGLAAAGDVMYPQDVTSTWEEVYAGSWYLNPGISVRCEGDGSVRLSQGAIAGIALSVMLLVIVIGLIIACCCADNKKRRVHSHHHPNNTRTIRTDSTPTVHYSNQRAWIQPRGPGTGRYLGPPTPRGPGGPGGAGHPPPPPPPQYSQAIFHGYGPPVQPPAYSSRPSTAAYPQAVASRPSGSSQYPPREPPPMYTAKADDAYPANVTD